MGGPGFCELRDTSEQRSKLLRRQSRISDDTAHRVGIDRVISWNRNHARAVSHHDVLALPSNPIAGSLKCSHGIEMIDPGDFWHDLDDDLDFPHFAVVRLPDSGLDFRFFSTILFTESLFCFVKQNAEILAIHAVRSGYLRRVSFLDE